MIGNRKEEVRVSTVLLLIFRKSPPPSENRLTDILISKSLSQSQGLYPFIMWSLYHLRHHHYLKNMFVTHQSSGQNVSNLWNRWFYFSVFLSWPYVWPLSLRNFSGNLEWFCLSFNKQFLFNDPCMAQQFLFWWGSKLLGLFFAFYGYVFNTFGKGV